MSRILSIAAAAVVGALGFFATLFGSMYIAGMFGLSTAFAAQIVNAVSVGGLALSIVMGLLSGGIAAAVIGTARWAITKWGKQAAVA